MSDMTVEELYSLRDQDLQIIDVREPDECAAGMIAGAKNIPLSQFLDRFQEIDQAVTVIAVCRSGNRSGQAQAFLETQGYTVKNLAGGMLDWLERNFPVTQTSQ